MPSADVCKVISSPFPSLPNFCHSTCYFKHSVTTAELSVNLASILLMAVASHVVQTSKKLPLSSLLPPNPTLACLRMIKSPV